MITTTVTPKKQTRALTSRSQLAKQVVDALVVIDSAVEQYHLLAEAVATSAAVVILDREQDGVQQLLAAMHRFSTVTTIHIIAHGAPGCLRLGNGQLDANSLDRYGWDLLTSFSEHTFSLCLYSGNVAAGDVGSDLMQKLHRFTGANIAASTAPTGNAARGGDWNLGYRIGQINPVLPIAQEVLEAYPGLLTMPC